jgi:hypothetical protein
MRIESGKTDQVVFFVAFDSSDLVTRETGLSSFTVYRSRNGGAATAYTTPTVTELSAANMPGVYALTIDEDTTIASTSASEEYCIHITHAGMAPVTRTLELYSIAAIADGILDRDMATGTDSGSASVRTVRQALRFLRNKWAIVGSTLTVYKEDDAATAWTATVQTNSAQDPVSSSDPA